MSAITFGIASSSWKRWLCRPSRRARLIAAGQTSRGSGTRSDCSSPSPSAEPRANPDCGLKTRGYAETEAALRNLVRGRPAGARQARVANRENRRTILPIGETTRPFDKNLLNFERTLVSP
jgi:hypothetical protein